MTYHSITATKQGKHERQNYPSDRKRYAGHEKNSLKRKCQCFGARGRGRAATLHLRNI
ncbi:MAG: hypothetical protein J6I65_03770 [Lachnospiraceae bacterium]|nr:hypothetical protein [Lachnospiraceae bacterium]